MRTSKKSTGGKKWFKIIRKKKVCNPVPETPWVPSGYDRNLDKIEEYPWNLRTTNVATDLTVVQMRKDQSLYRIFKITKKSTPQLHLEEMYKQYPNLSKTHVNAALVLSNNNVNDAQVILELQIRLEYQKKRGFCSDVEGISEPLNLSADIPTSTQEEVPKVNLANTVVLPSSNHCVIESTTEAPTSHSYTKDLIKISVADNLDNQKENPNVFFDLPCERVTDRTAAADNTKENTSHDITVSTNKGNIESNKKLLHMLQAAFLCNAKVPENFTLTNAAEAETSTFLNENPANNGFNTNALRNYRKDTMSHKNALYSKINNVDLTNKTGPSPDILKTQDKMEIPLVDVNMNDVKVLQEKISLSQVVTRTVNKVVLKNNLKASRRAPVQKKLREIRSKPVVNILPVDNTLDMYRSPEIPNVINRQLAINTKPTCCSDIGDKRNSSQMQPMHGDTNNNVSNTIFNASKRVPKSYGNKENIVNVSNINVGNDEPTVSNIVHEHMEICAGYNIPGSENSSTNNASIHIDGMESVGAVKRDLTKVRILSSERIQISTIPENPIAQLPDTALAYGNSSTQKVEKGQNSLTKGISKSKQAYGNLHQNGPIKDESTNKFPLSNGERAAQGPLNHSFNGTQSRLQIEKDQNLRSNENSMLKQAYGNLCQNDHIKDSQVEATKHSQLSNGERPAHPRFNHSNRKIGNGQNLRSNGISMSKQAYGNPQNVSIKNSQVEATNSSQLSNGERAAQVPINPRFNGNQSNSEIRTSQNLQSNEISMSKQAYGNLRQNDSIKDSQVKATKNSQLSNGKRAANHRFNDNQSNRKIGNCQNLRSNGISMSRQTYGNPQNVSIKNSQVEPTNNSQLSNGEGAAQVPVHPRFNGNQSNRGIGNGQNLQSNGISMSKQVYGNPQHVSIKNSQVEPTNNSQLSNGERVAQVPVHPRFNGNQSNREIENGQNLQSNEISMSKQVYGNPQHVSIRNSQVEPTNNSQLSNGERVAQVPVHPRFNGNQSNREIENGQNLQSNGISMSKQVYGNPQHVSIRNSQVEPTNNSQLSNGERVAQVPVHPRFNGNQSNRGIGNCQNLQSNEISMSKQTNGNLRQNDSIKDSQVEATNNSQLSNGERIAQVPSHPRFNGNQSNREIERGQNLRSNGISTSKQAYGNPQNVAIKNSQVEPTNNCQLSNGERVAQVPVHPRFNGNQSNREIGNGQNIQSNEISMSKQAYGNLRQNDKSSFNGNQSMREISGIGGISMPNPTHNVPMSTAQLPNSIVTSQLPHNHSFDANRPKQEMAMVRNAPNNDIHLLSKQAPQAHISLPPSAPINDSFDNCKTQMRREEGANLRDNRDSWTNGNTLMQTHSSVDDMTKNMPLVQANHNMPAMASEQRGVNLPPYANGPPQENPTLYHPNMYNKKLAMMPNSMQPYNQQQIGSLPYFDSLRLPNSNVIPNFPSVNPQFFSTEYNNNCVNKPSKDQSRPVPSCSYIPENAGNAIPLALENSCKNKTNLLIDHTFPQGTEATNNLGQFGSSPYWPDATGRENIQTRYNLEHFSGAQLQYAPSTETPLCPDMKQMYQRSHMMMQHNYMQALASTLPVNPNLPKTDYLPYNTANHNTTGRNLPVNVPHERNASRLPVNSNLAHPPNTAHHNTVNPALVPVTKENVPVNVSHDRNASRIPANSNSPPPYNTANHIIINPPIVPSPGSLPVNIPHGRDASRSLLKSMQTRNDQTVVIEKVVEVPFHADNEKEPKSTSRDIIRKTIAAPACTSIPNKKRKIPTKSSESAYSAGINDAQPASTFIDNVKEPISLSTCNQAFLNSNQNAVSFHSPKSTQTIADDSPTENISLSLSNNQTLPNDNNSNIVNSSGPDLSPSCSTSRLNSSENKIADDCHINLTSEKIVMSKITSTEQENNDTNTSCAAVHQADNKDVSNSNDDQPDFSETVRILLVNLGTTFTSILDSSKILAWSVVTEPEYTHAKALFKEMQNQVLSELQRTQNKQGPQNDSVIHTTMIDVPQNSVNTTALNLQSTNGVDGQESRDETLSDCRQKKVAELVEQIGINGCELLNPDGPERKEVVQVVVSQCVPEDGQSALVTANISIQDFQNDSVSNFSDGAPKGPRPIEELRSSKPNKRKQAAVQSADPSSDDGPPVRNIKLIFTKKNNKYAVKFA